MTPQAPMTALDAALDKAVAIPSKRVARTVAALRRKHPRATPASLITLLERRFLRLAKASGAGVGIAAAAPGVGTAAAVGLTGAQMAAFLGATAMHVMAVAEIHGIPAADHERRRMLLLTVLLGEEGANAVQASLGLSTIHWARQALTRMPTSTVRSVNKALRKHAMKTSATKGGTLAFARLAPFGIGAAVGWVGGKAMAKTVLEGTASVFGPPPESFDLASPARSRLLTDVN